MRIRLGRAVALFAAWVGCFSCGDDAGVRGSVCGNGRVDPGEACDYFNGSCSSDCSRVESCGDGHVDGMEACDTGSDPHCPPGCRVAAVCGDGYAAPGFETCDDGNDDSGDGCSDCRQNRGYACSGSPSVCKYGPPIDGSTTVAALTASEIQTLCKWATDDLLGGEGKTLSCAASVTGFAIVDRIENCIRNSQGSSCRGTIGAWVACLTPLTATGVDICAAVSSVNDCIMRVCAGPPPKRAGMPCNVDLDCLSSSCASGKCGGTHDVLDGNACEEDDWCTKEHKCCLEASGNVCRGVSPSGACLKVAGEVCSGGFDCISGECVFDASGGSRCS